VEINRRPPDPACRNFSNPDQHFLNARRGRIGLLSALWSGQLVSNGNRKKTEMKKTTICFAGTCFAGVLSLAIASVLSPVMAKPIYPNSVVSNDH